MYKSEDKTTIILLSSNLETMMGHINTKVDGQKLAKTMYIITTATTITSCTMEQKWKGHSKVGSWFRQQHWTNCCNCKIPMSVTNIIQLQKQEESNHELLAKANLGQVCVLQRSLHVDLHKKIWSHCFLTSKYSFDVNISAQSKEPSYFLCVLILVWSITLEWYFISPSFWQNHVAVYKVCHWFLNILWMIHNFSANT
jgi:hypothetical protein